MGVHRTRRTRAVLVVVLPVAGWLLVRFARSGRAPGSLPVAGPAARRRSLPPAPRPVDSLTGHRPASSPHARDLAAHNQQVIEDYRGRHAAPGGDATS